MSGGAECLGEPSAWGAECLGSRVEEQRGFRLGKAVGREAGASAQRDPCLLFPKEARNLRFQQGVQEEVQAPAAGRTEGTRWPQAARQV